MRKSLLALFLGLAFLAAILWIYSWHASEKAIGIYLTKGGRAILAIERGWLGMPKVTDGGFPTLAHKIVRWPTMEVDATSWGDWLVLGQVEEYSIVGSSGLATGRAYLTLELQPSDTISGDWDLVSGELNVQFPALFGMEDGGTGWVAKGNPLLDFYYYLANKVTTSLKPPVPTLHFAMDPSESRARSFLHRVDDPRLLEYFRSRREGRLPQEAADCFWDAFADRPEDPYLVVHAVDVAAQSGNMDRATELMDEWRVRLLNQDDLLLRDNARNAFKTVWKARGSPPGDDLREIVETVKGDELSLSKRMDFFRANLQYDRLPTLSWPVVETAADRYIRLRKPANSVSLQSAAGIAQTVATLDLLRGHREESLELFAGVYQFGQMVGADGPFYHRILSGPVIRNRALSGLELYVLNACETPEDFYLCWEILERLDKVRGQETGENLLDGEWTAPVASMKQIGGAAFMAVEEAKLRVKVANTRFQLLRLATAAKAQSLLTKEFPQSASQFAPYLPDGPPEDVFAEAPLRFTEKGIEPYAVYSVGPDMKDNGGSIDYDPTNGSRSAGDLVIRIPAEREYPFPREGIRAKDASDVLAQFPNGLPPDNFPGPSLSIVDSSTDYPVVVFSLARMETQGWKENLKAYRMPGMVPYDHTVELQPGTQPGSLRIQRVYSPDEPDPSRDLLILGPRYDPTNGLNSSGSIFIEIPH